MANKIDIKTVNEIAHLARLEFDEASKPEILHDMNRMLAFIDKLSIMKIYPVNFWTPGTLSKRTTTSVMPKLTSRSPIM